jgi:hypothetical protein
MTMNTVPRSARPVWCRKEAAHATLHTDLEATDYVEHRGRCEVDAESVAYVLAGLVDLDTSAYSAGYVTTWAKGDLTPSATPPTTSFTPSAPSPKH